MYGLIKSRLWKRFSQMSPVIFFKSDWNSSYSNLIQYSQNSQDRSFFTYKSSSFWIGPWKLDQVIIILYKISLGSFSIYNIIYIEAEWYTEFFHFRKVIYYSWTTLPSLLLIMLHLMETYRKIPMLSFLGGIFKLIDRCTALVIPKSFLLQYTFSHLLISFPVRISIYKGLWYNREYVRFLILL